MSNINGNFTDGVFTLDDDGANSQTLLLSNGDWKLSGLVPGGRQIEVSETRGATTGLRQGPRAYPTITVSAKLAAPLADFQKLALGESSGFISTTADIGDARTNDGDFSCNYGAESRTFAFDDLLLTALEYSEGSPNTIAFTFQIIGPVVIDGVTVIDAR